MPGAFGRLDDQNPTHFPGDRLVEQNPRLDAVALNRAGALVDGAETTVTVGGRGYLLARQTPDLLITAGDRQHRVTIELHLRGMPWFICPQCQRRRYHLYPTGEAFACRVCCGLDYSCRHKARSVPGVHRIAKWRRQLGVDLHPFTLLPKYPVHHTRKRCLVQKIIAEENKLIAHLGKINFELDRRARLRGILPK